MDKDYPKINGILIMSIRTHTIEPIIIVNIILILCTVACNMRQLYRSVNNGIIMSTYMPAQWAYKEVTIFEDDTQAHIDTVKVMFIRRMPSLPSPLDEQIIVTSPIWLVRWMNELERILFETSEGLFYTKPEDSSVLVMLIPWEIVPGQVWDYAFDAKFRMIGKQEISVGNRYYDATAIESVSPSFTSETYYWTLDKGLVKCAFVTLRGLHPRRVTITLERIEAGNPRTSHD